MVKRINNDLQNITQKTKDRATRTPLKAGGEVEKGQQFLLHMWHSLYYSFNVPHLVVCKVNVLMAKSCIFSNNVLWNINVLWGPSWSRSYGSWIYNYLWNQCPSSLTLWIRTPFVARCNRYNIMWQSLSVTYGRSVVFSGYSAFLHQ
jgi:hypothetical protein